MTEETERTCCRCEGSRRVDDSRGDWIGDKPCPECCTDDREPESYDDVNDAPQ